jgi:mRNA-degrading endonuclease toxin of MazEF toxin-antitoxin module
MSEQFDRGHVVWHPALFRDSGRPFLVLSDDKHPFHGEEYLVTALTTTERPPAVPVPDDEWVAGGLSRTSYVSPWFLTTLKHESIERGVGQLSQPLVTEIREAVGLYLGLSR